LIVIKTEIEPMIYRTPGDHDNHQHRCGNTQYRVYI